MFYHETNDLTEKIKIGFNRNQVLEQKLSALDNEKAQIEGNMRIQIKQFAEDNKSLNFHNKITNSVHEKLFPET